MLKGRTDPFRDLADLEELMDELSVSDRHLELAAGSGSLGDVGGGSSNPGVNCTGGCN
jgi:hypothetical protein